MYQSAARIIIMDSILVATRVLATTAVQLLMSRKLTESEQEEGYLELANANTIRYNPYKDRIK